MNKFSWRHALYFALFTFIFGSAVVGVRDSFSTTQRTADELTDILEKLNAAIVEKNETEMEAFFPENITITANSVRWNLSRKELMSQLTSANVKTFVVKNYSLQFRDGRAELNCDQQEIMFHNDREVSHHANYTYLFFQHQGNWKVAEIIRHN